MCPKTLRYYTTDVKPSQPLVQKLFLINLASNFISYFHPSKSFRTFSFLWESLRIFENSFLSVGICENLWSFLKSFLIFENLWESTIIFWNIFLSVRICENPWSFYEIFSYLWESVRISQNRFISFTKLNSPVV